MNASVPNDVRSSCFELMKQARHIVNVNISNIPTFVDKFMTMDQISRIREHITQVDIHPFTFDTIEQEVNFTALACLLAFGSGYRRELHDLINKGAADTMTYTVIAMYTSNNDLNADFLEARNTLCPIIL